MTRLHDSYLAERRSPWGQVMFTRRRASWPRRMLMALVRFLARSHKSEF